MKLRYLTFVGLALLLALPSAATLYQEKKPDPAKTEQKKAEEPKKDPDVEKYEKAVKELTKVEGPFTFYVRKKDILLELPEDKLGKLFNIQPTLATGFAPMGAQAGDPIGDGGVYVFRFERHDDSIWLVRPNVRYRWDKSDPLAIASARSFPEAVLADFNIEQKHPERRLLLLNVTGLLNGSLFQLQDMVNAAAGGSYSLDRDKTTYAKVKSYGDNTVVRVKLFFESAKGASSPLSDLLAALGLASPNQLEDSRSAPLEVTYNLWYRKPTGYMPRLADSRVGFFSTSDFSVGRFYEVDRKQRWIARFNLKKKDPRAPMSEPVEPIVWYVDNSVPEKYRESVRKGILFWNAAFEGIGYRNAVVVKDAPKDDPDWDHADGRHNLVRWAMSEGSAYAIALLRPDPLTGEIYNAAVTVDANYPASLLNEYKTLVKSAQARPQDLAFKALLRGGDDRQTFAAFERLLDPARADREQLRAKAGALGWRLVEAEYAREFGERAAMGLAMLKSTAGKVDEETYMKAAVADLVAHEVGHCFGLRHNFAASTNLTTEQLLDDALVNKVGLTASVMDYNPVNVMAVLRGHGVFFNPCVGPYDKWAIRYGYGDVVAGSPEGEKYQLDLIARESGKPGHLYLTDEDADGVNPLAVRFDGAKDSVNFAAKEMQGLRKLRGYAIRSMTKPGQSYALRNRIVLNTLVRGFTQARDAVRYVGGVEYRRNHRLDLGEMPTLRPVEAKLQRQAASLIVRECLSVNSVDLPDDVLVSLSQDSDDDSDISSRWIAPLRRLIGSQQTALLASLMAAKTTDQIAENELKTRGQAERYTLLEHYGMLLSAVYKEVGQGVPVTELRRDLQRFMLEGLIVQASAPSGGLNEDVRSIASQSLKRLHARFQAALKQGARLDSMTRMHLTDMADRIERYEKRQVVGDR